MENLFTSFSHLFALIGSVFSVVLSFWFIVLPPALFALFKILWMPHVWGHFGSKIKWVLLEIVPPKDIEKSPLPMESIFAGLAGVSKGILTYDAWVRGEFPTSFSLEIASVEGQVHFYIRTQSGFRNLVEAHFYAQYPNIELVEVPDYTEAVPRTVPNKDWDLWGSDFVLVKDDLYPIRTYKYFEESVTGKMIDPLAGLIETMSKAGPGQHMWFQMIISPESEKWYKTGKETVDAFIGKTKEEKPGLLTGFLSFLGDIVKNIVPALLGHELSYSAAEEKAKKEFEEGKATYGQRETLKALEANLGKLQFKTKMRYVYVGRVETFSKTTGVSSFVGGIKQFNDQNLNSFKPDDGTKTAADYLFVQSRLRLLQRRIFRRFVSRDSDPQTNRFLLSTEELATIFHIPDMQITAPSLNRIAAKTSGAPTNLPIQE